MQKYFINENIELNKSFKIESSDQHHIEKVMRNKNGDQIICVDLKHIQYLCLIENVQEGTILPIEKLDINNELEMAILSAMENEYIKKSRVLDTKDGSINGLSIMILKERFSEETLIKGMKYIKENIDRDFHTLSYISRIIKSMDK